MRNFILRRIFVSIFILFFVSVMIYALIRAMPSDYVQQMLAANPAVTDEMARNLRRLYGLDAGVVKGYLGWAARAVRLDFGQSFVYKKSVAAVIADKASVSFALSFSAFVLELLVAIPLGIYCAANRYTKKDFAISAASLCGISMPSFFFAAILQKIFAINLKWFPLQGMVNARADWTGLMKIADIAHHFCLPVAVFVFTDSGSLVRYVRTNMAESLSGDYIRTARAKGLDEKTVFYRHAFRNTLIPIVTMVGASIPGLFSGAIITEQIFAIDGLGFTAFQALKAGDIPFIMGFNMFLATLTLLGTLLSDILYAAADPRVRLE